MEAYSVKKAATDVSRSRKTPILLKEMGFIAVQHRVLGMIPPVCLAMLCAVHF
jgi:hypothetical protein